VGHLEVTEPKLEEDTRAGKGGGYVISKKIRTKYGKYGYIIGAHGVRRK
jgi:hypothetical protein